jgi:hypothetical protein
MVCASSSSDSFDETTSPESSPRNPRKCSVFPENAGHKTRPQMGCFPSSEAHRGVAQLGSAPALGPGCTYHLTCNNAVSPTTFPPIPPSNTSRSRTGFPITPVWNASPPVTRHRAPDRCKRVTMTDGNQQLVSGEFATARAIATRWSCHVDTVYSRLAKAGVAEFRFSSRFIRWKWSDVLAFERASIAVPGQSPGSTQTASLPPSRKRGPQRFTPSQDKSSRG